MKTLTMLPTPKFVHCLGKSAGFLALGGEPQQRYFNSRLNKCLNIRNLYSQRDGRTSGMNVQFSRELGKLRAIVDPLGGCDGPQSVGQLWVHDAAQQFFHAAIRCRDGETRHLFAGNKGRITKDSRYLSDRLEICNYRWWLKKVKELSFEGVTEEYIEQYRKRFIIEELEPGYAGEKRRECFGNIEEFREKAKLTWTTQVPNERPSYLAGKREEEEEEEEMEEEEEGEEEEQEEKCEDEEGEGGVGGGGTEGDE